MKSAEKQFQAMKQFNADFTDMPDGAFFAMAEDTHGWDAYDWAWFADECEARKTYITDKKGITRENPNPLY